MIWIDSREPPTLRTKVLVACQGDGQIACLEAGDFVLFDPNGCSVGIERKSVSDLLNSLASKRLDKQLRRMADYYSHRYLLIEGALEMDPEGYIKLKRRSTHWTHASIQGYLWSLQHSGVGVLWSAGAAETVDLLRVLHQRSLVKCLITGEPAPKIKAG